MKLRRSLVTATFAAAITATFVPATANAAFGIEGGGGVFIATGGANGHIYTGTITTEVFPDGQGTVLVTWECQAEATPDGISTTISDCSVNGVHAPAITVAGPVAATARTAVFPVGVEFVGCIAGFSSFAETQLGSQSAAVPESCGKITTDSV